MIDWMARAKTQLGQPRGGGTAETDESDVVSVSSVVPVADAGVAEVVSSVSSAALGTDLAASRPSANPYRTPEEGEDCHACGWNDAEIAAFMARRARFEGLGRVDAEHLAERLTLRDRDGDERRLCLECSWLGSGGRCLAAASGRIPGVDRRLVEPVQTVLHRCVGFGLRKGLF